MPKNPRVWGRAPQKNDYFNNEVCDFTEKQGLSRGMSICKREKIFVHIHIYYLDMWNEIKEQLNNIVLPYDLYVTMVKRDALVCFDILSYKEDANIEVIENRGFDIGAFVHVINKIDLKKYDYIIKLHTKGNVELSHFLVNRLDVSGDRWRKNLFSFLSSKELFVKILKLFEQNPNIGMVANKKVILSNRYDDKEEAKRFFQYMQEKDIEFKRYKFVAGSMFIARAYLFKELQMQKFKLNDFEIVTDIRKMQLAHVLERFLGFLVLNQGLKIVSYQNKFQIIQIEMLKIYSVLVRKCLDNFKKLEY